MGVDIQLHTFTYGRPCMKELERYCSRVVYYKRDTSFVNFFSWDPYIVASRDNKQLVHNLLQSESPILLEGLHCCACLEHLQGKKVFVRAHNVEHDYYRKLVDSESNLFKRLYYRVEATKLERYEPQLLNASCVLAVTETDADHFKEIGCRNVVLMPSSHADDDVVSKPGSGDYALYHADLSVAENVRAVEFIVEQLLTNANHKLIIAGRNPDGRVVKLAESHDNITLVPNPDDDTMHRLIADAQVNILLTDQPTGLKLKLLTSLYAGRHCLVNSTMVHGTKLGEVCTVADRAEELKAALDRLMSTPFTATAIEHRKQLLGNTYSNKANAQLLYSML